MNLTALVALVVAAAPVVGDVAPDFTVKDVDGVELSLSALVERGPVVLAFFSKAFTPG
jgi:peroxiredoxin Q/BCP